jgi:hypothetical protein
LVLEQQIAEYLVYHFDTIKLDIISQTCYNNIEYKEEIENELIRQVSEVVALNLNIHIDDVYSVVTKDYLIRILGEECLKLPLIGW